MENIATRTTPAANATARGALLATCELVRRDAESIIETLAEVARFYMFEDTKRAKRAYNARGRIKTCVDYLDAVITTGIQEYIAHALCELLKATRQASYVIASYNRNEESI
jgi:hypothetical protein